MWWQGPSPIWSSATLSDGSGATDAGADDTQVMGAHLSVGEDTTRHARAIVKDLRPLWPFIGAADGPLATEVDDREVQRQHISMCGRWTCRRECQGRAGCLGSIEVGRPCFILGGDGEGVQDVRQTVCTKWLRAVHDMQVQVRRLAVAAIADLAESVAAPHPVTLCAL